MAVVSEGTWAADPAESPASFLHSSPSLPPHCPHVFSRPHGTLIPVAGRKGWWAEQAPSSPEGISVGRNLEPPGVATLQAWAAEGWVVEQHMTVRRPCWAERVQAVGCPWVPFPRTVRKRGLEAWFPSVQGADQPDQSGHGCCTDARVPLTVT